MLTFLRRIRKSLINSGSTRKYLLYAIGEIALVVIGILIALQINNWNEERKSEQKVRLILGEIANDLIAEIDHSADILDFYFKKDSVNRIIQDDKINRESFKERGMLAPQYAMLNGMDVFVNRRSFDNLALIIEQVPERFDPLINELVTLYDQHGESVRKNFNQIQEHTAELQDYLMNNKTWFSNFINGRLSESAITYFLTDPIYKNMLTSFTKDLGDLMEAMTQYRARSIHFIRLLNEFQNPPMIQINIDSASWMLDEISIKENTGTYLSDKYDFEMEIEFSESRLYLVSASGRMELVPIDSTLYYGVGTGDKILFGIEGEGSVVARNSKQELLFLKDKVDSK